MVDYSDSHDIPDSKIAAAVGRYAEAQDNLGLDMLKQPLFDHSRKQMDEWVLDPQSAFPQKLSDSCKELLMQALGDTVAALEQANLPIPGQSPAQNIQIKTAPLVALEQQLLQRELNNYHGNRTEVARGLSAKIRANAIEIAKASGMSAAEISDSDMVYGRLQSMISMAHAR